MLSVIETFTICVLLFFGASVLSAENENVPTFQKSVEVLDSKKSPFTVTDRLHTEIKMKQRPTNEEKSSIPPLTVYLKDKLPTNKEESHKEELDAGGSVTVQDAQKKVFAGQILTTLDEGIKIKHPEPIKIKLQGCETDHESGVPSTWTQLQTRETRPGKGAILGLKKGTFKRSWSNWVSSTKSYLGKNVSLRKGKFQAGLDKQASVSEETSSVPTDAYISRPWKNKPESPPRPQIRSPAPWVPPQEPFEPFCLADNIKNINMIPGSGEFVYDTIIQRRTTTHNVFGQPQPINENNNAGMSDAMLSLDQLKQDLPNVEWVSVVVNWFGDSLNIRECQIYPAVEFQGGYVVTPEDWQVGHFRRANARLVSSNDDGSPRYGGTVSDGALRRYIAELHRRRYKVMLYPMLVFDTPDKGWRGKLTGPASEISFFFRNKYNPFIRHYANIAGQTKAEGFIIGSEFVGLTKIHDKKGNYPAVSELVQLAQEVKTQLGSDVTVTYAADWTEYHIASNGRYPLDELWASKFIDVVGINAYFPLTDDPEPDGGYTVKDVTRSWTLGEGYYYFYRYPNNRPELVVYPEKEHSKWAWKNIEKWWGESHYNSDGSQTAWRPKMKKIWFTEFGFPSVDGCTNEPHVFVDSSDKNKYPRNSNKQVSFRSQQVAIEGTLRKWQNSVMVEKMFLYAWDARPFPYFPRKLDVWADGVNWESGHWIQGKIRKITGDRRESTLSLRRSLSPPKRSQSGGAKFRRRATRDDKI